MRFADFILAIGLVGVCDIGLFHAGGYFRWLEPASYSGRIEEAGRRFDVTLEQGARRRVLVMSDSTGGACISERLLEQSLQRAGWPLDAINLSQGGTTARSWHKLLADPRIEARAIAMVVLGLHPDGLANSYDKPDLQIIKTRLQLGDALTLPATYPWGERRFEVFTHTLFRTPLFREDLVEFLRAPAARLAVVARSRADEARFRRGWRREILTENTLAEARLDASGKIDPSSVPHLQADPMRLGDLERVLRRRARFPGASRSMQADPEQLTLLRATIDMLRARGIVVVIAITPRSPFPFRGRDLAPLEVMLARGAPETLLFHHPEMLDRVESPQFFEDAFHVNLPGAGIYTEALARFLDQALCEARLKIVERRVES